MSDKKLKFLILPAGGSRRSSSILWHATEAIFIGSLLYLLLLNYYFF